MSSPTLPLSLITGVVISVGPQAPPQPTFNQGLIIGNSNVLPASSRVRQYLSTAAMLSDGFTTNSPEYIAAQLYFSQSPAPTFVWIGLQDPKSIAAANLHSGGGGTGHAVGDILTVTQAGGSGGRFQVTTVSSGVITGIVALPPANGGNGTGYAVANTLPTTSSGAGINATIDITAVGDTLLQAATYCRVASAQWYAFFAIGAAKADHLALAAFTQTATPETAYFFNTSDSDVPTTAVTDVFTAMKTLLYAGVLGIYSTTQAGAFPTNIYAAAAAMGRTMGLNTGFASSAFTLKFQALVGVAPEPLTFAQVANVEGKNGNLYVNYANGYTILEQGIQPNGAFFDETLNLSMFTSEIRYALMTLLVSVPKVPQSEAGQAQLIHAVNQVCQNARIRGFIAPGQWNGQQIINLFPGDPLETGFAVQSYPVASQSTADRQARKAMPIYVAINEAGAVHSISIVVNVQR